MKVTLLIIALSTAALAQASKPPTPTPELSTADKIALQSLEQQKQNAQNMAIQAQQNEAAIFREFSLEHAGWHIDAQTLVVTRDQAPAMDAGSRGSHPPIPPAAPKK